MEGCDIEDHPIGGYPIGGFSMRYSKGDLPIFKREQPTEI